MSHFDIDAERERQDALDFEFFGPRNELEAHYQNCQAGYFGHPDASQCGCRGSGYYLSQVDTWHECPYHHVPGQAHPEDDFEGADTTVPSPSRDTIPTPPPSFDEDDIPF